jgi:hypothetical protein
MPFDDASSATAQVFIVKDLKPSESRDVVYHIRREYYLDTDAILAAGQRLRRDYGYVDDNNPFSPNHNIAVTPAGIVVDGDPPS